MLNSPFRKAVQFIKNNPSEPKLGLCIQDVWVHNFAIDEINKEVKQNLRRIL
jgi:hypothetical protein